MQTQTQIKFMLALTLILIPPASAGLLFDGTFKQNDHFDTGSFGAFGASRVDTNINIITIMPADSLGREGFVAKWHLRGANDDQDYISYPNPIESNNPLQYALLYTDGTPLYISVGDDIWYGWSEYLDPTWVSSKNSWEVVGMSLDAWNIDAFGLQLYPGTTDNYFILKGVASSVPAFKMQTGIWYDIIYHIRWSYDASGFVEVYLKDQYQANYSLVYSISNVQTRMQNEHDNIDMNIGIYRSAKNTEDQIAYIMDPKIGTSMEDVVYGSPSYSPYKITGAGGGTIGPGLFDILKEKYITDISELPYSPGNPDMNWQQQGHIRAWIDIVGFRNLTKDNNIYYIFGDPVSLAIVQSDISVIVCSRCTITSLTKSQTISTSGNYITASLQVSLKYYKTHTRCTVDKNGERVCTTYRTYFAESATFTDTEIIPERFEKVLNLKINITEYNNTINPRTVLDLPISNLTFIDYVYKNERIQNYQKTARVEQTAKGIYFANLTKTNIWTAGTSLLHQMNDQVIIQKTASPDYPSLKVTVSNLYETKLITNYSIIRDTYSIERTFNSLFYTILFISLVLIAMIISIGKGIIK